MLLRKYITNKKLRKSTLHQFIATNNCSGGISPSQIREMNSTVLTYITPLNPKAMQGQAVLRMLSACTSSGCYIRNHFVSSC